MPGPEGELLVAEGRVPVDVPEHGEGVGGVGARPRHPPGQTHRAEIGGQYSAQNLKIGV